MMAGRVRTSEHAGVAIPPQSRIMINQLTRDDTTPKAGRQEDGMTHLRNDKPQTAPTSGHVSQ